MPHLHSTPCTNRAGEKETFVFQIISNFLSHFLISYSNTVKQLIGFDVLEVSSENRLFLINCTLKDKLYYDAYFYKFLSKSAIEY